MNKTELNPDQMGKVTGGNPIVYIAMEIMGLIYKLTEDSDESAPGGATGGW